MFETIINNIRNELTSNFSQIDHCFNMDQQLLSYQPSNGGWTIQQVLEHISLTNHSLLILIQKGTRKAIELSTNRDWTGIPDNYQLATDRLAAIGEHNAFEWIRPSHMEPAGLDDHTTIRKRLAGQLATCLDCLEQLNNGEGSLYTTTMTVNGLGKIDVYHYIYFLALHAKRHLTQIEKIVLEQSAQ